MPGLRVQTHSGPARARLHALKTSGARTGFARHQVMQQTGIATIVQSNTIAQTALRLLGG